MIVPMKKTAVICLQSDKQSALEVLRGLGVMHVETTEFNESSELHELQNKISDVTKAHILLQAVKGGNAVLKKNVDSAKGAEVSEKVLVISELIQDLNKELESLYKKEERLKYWGDFDFEMINNLKARGCFVYLCVSNHEFFAELQLKHTCKVINETSYDVYFAVISDNEINKEELPLASIPDGINLSKVREKIREIQSQLRDKERELINLKSDISALEEYLDELKEEAEFYTHRDGMVESGVLSCVSGYCPVPELEKLREASKKNGWGLQVSDPAESDMPPTLIKIPKIIACSKALFDFIGISPGYREWDTSGMFLIFFTIFFSIIFGDAGYGIIFLTAGIIAKVKLGKTAGQKTNYYINLFLLLSAGTVIWGSLSGSFFAIPSEKLPSWMRGIDWLTNPELKDKHVQLLCFLIAAVHLSMARLWKASLILNSRRCLGEIGWGLILWGNFFVAKKLIIYPESEWPMTIIAVLYGLGLLFVMVFGTNWFKMEEAFGFFFGLSGTFVDLLSYIRLFAVGLSSYYIAKSFNDMGLMVFNISDNKVLMPLLVFGMIFVMAFGHILNILLGFLGVMVHGIRLNTLEFSNHMGLQWGGHLYKPFAKRKDDSASERDSK